jgi:hypothetical protein
MSRVQALVVCPAGVWTELTAANATTVTFQVIGGSIEVRGAVGATPPTGNVRGYRYHARPDGKQSEQGELRLTLADLAAGANRLYARPINGRPAKVLVDHA